MKKTFLMTSAVALLLGMSANAQIKVTSNEIQLGNWLTVGSSEVEVAKPVPIGDFRIQKEGEQVVNIVNGYGYGVRLGSNGVSTTSNSVSLGDVVVIPPAVGPGGFLSPLEDLKTDLGSSNYRYRYLYMRKAYSVDPVSVTSDSRYKENVRDLKEATAKIAALRPVSFDFKAELQGGDTTGLKGKVGFLAQEVQEVLPGLVEYLPEVDMYTMNYEGLIPYIVEAFQEERAEVESLRTENEAMSEAIEAMQEEIEALKSALEGMGPAAQGGKAPEAPAYNEDEGDEVMSQGYLLYQNMPNPFSEETRIRYELPSTAQSAVLQLFDMQGRKVMERSLPQGVESGEVEISGNTLQPGMYTYALVVSGKVMASKKMVVTE